MRKERDGGINSSHLIYNYWIQSRKQISYNNFSVNGNQTPPTEILICICSRTYGQIKANNINSWVKASNINLPS